MIPQTRLEKWLAKIAGEEVDITPKDRFETLLAKIAGDDVTITPDDRFEYWLNQIAENGGGGSSDFSTATVTLNITSESGEPIRFGSGSLAGAQLMTQLPVPDGYTMEHDDYVYFVQKTLTGTPSELTVVLSNDTEMLGVAMLALKMLTSYGHGRTVTLTGENTTLSDNVSYDAEGSAFLITGDCTITAHIDDVN